MKLRDCTCGNKITTKNAKGVQRADLMGSDTIFFTCPQCRSTFVLMAKKKETKELRGAA
jgi:DNA-directed RNA polymerase subunit RPC12/RpoP